MDILIGLALSAHLGFSQDFNSIHPHARLQHNNFIAGAFYNSEEAMSAYAGIKLGKGKLNYEIGIVTGYSDAEILPYLRTTYELTENSHVFAAPAIADSDIGIVLGIEFQIKK
jgi:hypothetical protein